MNDTSVNNTSGSMADTFSCTIFRIAWLAT